jgi:hypothetical protein
VNFIKEFIQLFISDKTEEMILRRVEEPESLYWDHTIVRIQAQIKGKVTYNERVVIYPEEEYHPKFLQLCDLFLNIARTHTKAE